MSIDTETLGKAVQQLRAARGLTQRQLAVAAGLSKGGKSVALIEQGRRSVSLGTLNALATALDIPPACLAVLGSAKVKGGKEVVNLMKSLKDLILAVVTAQAEARIEDQAEKSKRESIQADMAELASLVGPPGRNRRALGARVSHPGPRHKKTNRQRKRTGEPVS